MNKKNIIIFMLIMTGAILILGGARRVGPVAEKNENTEVKTENPAVSVDQEMARWLIHEGRLKLRMGKLDRASFAAGLAALFDPEVKCYSLEPKAVIQPLEPPPEISTTTKIDEARDFVRTGNAAQARLSLLETIEHDHDSAKAARLLEEIKDGEQGFPAAVKINGDIAENSDALRLFHEGQILKSSGEIVEACKRLDLAALSLAKETVKPAFAAPLEEARRECATRMKNNLAPELAAIAGDIEAFALKDARTAVNGLISSRDAVAKILSRVPNDESATTLFKKVDAMIRSAADRWIGSAITAESLSGCPKTLPIYREISEKLKNIEPSSSERATEGIIRCEQEKK